MSDKYNMNLNKLGIYKGHLILIFAILFQVSCSKLEKKEADGDSTPIRGEFTSNEIAEVPQEEEFYLDLEQFQENKFGSYKIKKGDSLLLISFKLYGDYKKWETIKHFNPKLNKNLLVTGNTLKYPLPKIKFIYRPKGNPYLILNGDSLTGISVKKYRDGMKWRTIWDNNKPLIKDPDHIFAGFTIFYVPDPKVIELTSLSQMGKVPVYKAQKVAAVHKVKQKKIKVESKKIVEVKEDTSRMPASIIIDESRPESETSAKVLSNKIIPSEPSN